MKKVILYGELRKRFGKEYYLNVSNVAQAIRALSALVKGFQNYLVINSEPGYLIKVDGKYLEEENLTDTIKVDTIRIIPYIVGSSGVFKAILGAALIVIGIVTSQPWLIKFGISTLLSGIAEVLFTPPVPEIAGTKEEAKPSYAFDGPVNTARQGNPVPVCYGKLLVGSQIISAVILAKDI